MKKENQRIWKEKTDSPVLMEFFRTGRHCKHLNQKAFLLCGENMIAACRHVCYCVTATQT